MSDGQRDQFTLPSDNHAECCVINYGQTYPSSITHLGITPEDFLTRKHRQIWSSMVSVQLERPEVIRPGDFYVLLTQSIQTDEHLDMASVLSAVDASADWWLDPGGPDSPSRDIAYFAERLRCCTRARKLIDAAQQIAERAYRVPSESFDIDDAGVVLSRVAGSSVPTSPGLELPI